MLTKLGMNTSNTELKDFWILTAVIQIYRMNRYTDPSFSLWNKRYFLWQYFKYLKTPPHESPPSSELLFWIMVPLTVPQATGYPQLRATPLVLPVIWPLKAKASGTVYTGAIKIKLAFWTWTLHRYRDISFWFNKLASHIFFSTLTSVKTGFPHAITVILF